MLVCVMSTFTTAYLVVLLFPYCSMYEIAALNHAQTVGSKHNVYPFVPRSCAIISIESGLVQRLGFGPEHAVKVKRCEKCL